MSTRIFEDTQGKIWIVTMYGSNIEVSGCRNVKLSLYQIAISCALKLGITQTKNGFPIESVKEHNRIWKVIWEKGYELTENPRKS